MEPYKFQREFSISNAAENSLKGKTAIVTGGASGIGQVYVRNLAAAGAFVVVGDFNELLGERLSAELPNVHFEKCDVTAWEDQVRLFQAACRHSPRNRIDIVIANAGIACVDPVYAYEDQEEPSKPSLDVLDVNLSGAIYTTKLAMHHFRRQYGRDADPSPAAERTCLILQGSVSGYLDQGGAPQYSASKFAIRGLVRSYRRTSWVHGTRVNCVSPWYVKTPILSQRSVEAMNESGFGFAEIDDVAAAMMGLVVDSNVNGRNLFVVPRHLAPGGVIVDSELDEFKEGSVWAKLQEGALVSTQRLIAPHLDMAAQ